MAYGDTGVNDGAKGTYLAAPYGWTWGQITGTDKGGAPKTADVQFIVDSGAAAPVVNSTDLTGFQVVFGGAAGVATPGSKVPSLLGGLFWQVSAGVYALDTKGKKLTIS
jgi:hypothetical protein